MKPTVPRLRTILAVLALALSGPLLAGAATFHFGLTRSVPADKATVHTLPEVKLWFTEQPSQGTVSIRLINAAGEAVPTADPRQDPEDDKAFGVALTSAAAPGNYTVSWRGMGDDGHVVRGELSFLLAGH